MFLKRRIGCRERHGMILNEMLSLYFLLSGPTSHMVQQMEEKNFSDQLLFV